MTEEDEAFDELAKRQGAWGGGYRAKKAMAADKLQEPEREALKLALEALERINPKFAEDVMRQHEATAAIKAALAQPAQEREWVGLTDEEREGVAQDYSLTGLGYQSPFKAIEAMLKEKNP